MEDQFEEGDALEVGAWNTEYDIAEDEEERLLEEHEVMQPNTKHAFQYENEANFSDHEYEVTENEEDILDLGLNDDIIEYEDVSASEYQQQSTGNNDKVSILEIHNEDVTVTSTNQVRNNSVKPLIQNSVPVARKPITQYRKNVYPSHPVNNFHAPMQRTVPPYRMGHSGFRNQQRPPFDGHNRYLMERPPLVVNYRNPPPFPSRSGILGEGNQLQDVAQGLQRIQQQRDQHLHNQQFSDRNFNGNRFFVNPHYRGSVTVHHSGINRMPFLQEQGPAFASSDNFNMRMAFRGQQRPPAGQNMMNTSRMPPPPTRFPPTHQLPRPNVEQRAPAPYKSSTPQNLMDMVLRPYSEAPPRVPCYPGPQRFHYELNERRCIMSHEVALPSQFLRPPPNALKRPSPVEVRVETPFKNLRMGPIENITIYRSFPPPIMNSTHNPSNIIISTAPPIRQQPSTTSSNASTVKSSPVFTVDPSPSIPFAMTTESAASAPPLKTFTSSTQNGEAAAEDVTPEMKEYLNKMEEQRKKREEVLRLKEERRRAKLQSGDSQCSVNVEAKETHSGPISAIPPAARASNFPSPIVTSKPSILNQPPSSYSGTSPAGNPIPATNITCSTAVKPIVRKTVLVKPTTVTQQPMTRVIPQTAAGVNRRYKVIILKNKSGKILEKRRVPIDEVITNTRTNIASCNPSGNTLKIQSICSQPSRVSETVAIENLNSSATEDDVRNLCQMFGPVQEVYPKLQEGKAIVRFTSVTGANNFLTNHNTAGIYVRYL